jgi:hypothetical protein
MGRQPLPKQRLKKMENNPMQSSTTLADRDFAVLYRIPESIFQ